MLGGEKNISEEIMAENFWNLMKTIKILGSLMKPKAQNMKEITPTHIIIKLFRTNDKEKILKADKQTNKTC